MAKKKAKNKFEDDVVSNAIVKKYGDIVEEGTKVLKDLESFKNLSISPALDLALGGGLREGSVTIMAGDPKTGKTTTALYAAAKAQAAGKTVVYFNTEGRLTKENFKGIKGLDVENIKIVQATDAQPVVSRSSASARLILDRETRNMAQARMNSSTTQIMKMIQPSKKWVNPSRYSNPT